MIRYPALSVSAGCGVGCCLSGCLSLVPTEWSSVVPLQIQDNWVSYCLLRLPFSSLSRFSRRRLIIFCSLPLRKVFYLVEGNSSIVAHLLGRFSSVWVSLEFFNTREFPPSYAHQFLFEEGPKFALRLESLLFSDYNPSRLESKNYTQSFLS